MRISKNYILKYSSGLMSFEPIIILTFQSKKFLSSCA